MASTLGARLKKWPATLISSWNFWPRRTPSTDGALPTLAGRLPWLGGNRGRPVSGCHFLEGLPGFQRFF
jgi:hypothetical protein